MENQNQVAQDNRHLFLQFWRLEVQSQGVNGAELSLTALGANSSLPCSCFQCRLTILDFSCLEMLHYSLCVCTSSFCAYLCIHMSLLYACQLYWMRVHTMLCYAMLSHFSCVRLCVTPQMAAHQAPPFLGFSRQEHWRGLPFPSPIHESEK